MSVASARQSIPTFRCNLCLSIQKMFEPMTAGSGNNRTPAAKQYFTSCFHLLCNSCRFKNLQNCAFCNRSCQFMGCSSNMPKQYQLYFKPILYAKRQFITVLKFQRTQNSIAKRRLAAKVVYIEKKRAMAMQKVKERQERCQRAKEMEHKLQTAHQILCQEKRWVVAGIWPLGILSFPKAGKIHLIFFKKKTTFIRYDLFHLNGKVYLNRNFLACEWIEIKVMFS